MIVKAVMPDSGAIKMIWLGLFALLTEVGNSFSYRKAIEADNKDRWIIVMEQEMEFLDRNQTWEFIFRRVRKQLVTSGSFAEKTSIIGHV